MRMSAIDQYRCRALGVIELPTEHNFFRHTISDRDAAVRVPIYYLEQDISERKIDFQCREGDILLGETPVLHIFTAEALAWLTRHADYDKLHDEYEYALYKQKGIARWHETYWRERELFAVQDGCAKAGWDPNDSDVSYWLMQHILQFLVNTYPQHFASFVGAEPIGEDGNICHVLTAEEDKYWNWKLYDHRFDIE